ncbi:MAG: hypothetical protein ACO1N9_07495 [Flavobacterium sp.]
MEEYFVSAASIVCTKKRLLPGNGYDERCLQHRLQAGLGLLSELKEELENFAGFFILINQPMTNRQMRLLSCINNELISSFISTM